MANLCNDATAYSRNINNASFINAKSLHKLKKTTRYKIIVTITHCYNYKIKFFLIVYASQCKKQKTSAVDIIIQRKLSTTKCIQSIFKRKISVNSQTQ